MIAVGQPLDLRSGDGRGVVWGLAGEDLNINVVAWPAGDGVALHTNSECDVLITLIDGALVVVVDDATHTIGPGQAIVVPRGSRRSLTAGDAGARYLTTHRLRGPLTLSPSA
jgi:quercetin dioxygenase-like cupin family protein